MGKQDEFPKCFYDMTVLEILREMERGSLGKIAFDGPGSKGPKVERHVVTFVLNPNAKLPMSR